MLKSCTSAATRKLTAPWRDDSSVCILFPLPFSLLQPLGHLFVIRGVARPALRGRVPTVILNGHVDAAVDEELHRLVVPVPHQLVQDARRLMGAPGRVDVRAVLK